MRLLHDDVQREPFAEASQFREAFFACLTARRDELFELADALLCADGPVTTPVDLTLLAEHRRGHGALYDALNRGCLDAGRLRRTPAALPQPKAADDRGVLASHGSAGSREACRGAQRQQGRIVTAEGVFHPTDRSTHTAAAHADKSRSPCAAVAGTPRGLPPWCRQPRRLVGEFSLAGSHRRKQSAPRVLQTCRRRRSRRCRGAPVRAAA